MHFLRCTPRLPLSPLSRRLHNAHNTPVTLGIRCEDPARVWERRTPLTPDVVAELIQKDGVRVLVQECERRVFPMDEYIKAGAEVHPTLDPAHIILGIKETPLPSLLTTPVLSVAPSTKHTLRPRIQVMFSHTIKGQEYNMPLLSRFLSGGYKYADSTLGDNGPVATEEEEGLEARLIDYELLVDADGKRTVAFGWFAGVAGALESLYAMADMHLKGGVASPFLYTPRPHSSPSLEALRSTLRWIANQISEHGTPRSLGPCVIGVTGNGKVSQGALSILSELPVVYVKVEDLPALVNDPNTDLTKVYVVHALPDSYLSRTDGKYYDRSDYYANPLAYQSHFHTKIAPYLTLFLNGAGWTTSCPRLLLNAHLNQVHTPRLAAIGDISCDIDGALEFVARSTTIDSPCYTVGSPSPSANGGAGWKGLGVSVMAVDILPATLPKDASQSFAGAVKDYVRALIAEQKGEEYESRVDPELRKALRRASVTIGGRVTGGDESSFDEAFREVLEGKVRKWRESKDGNMFEKPAGSTRVEVGAYGRGAAVGVVGGETEEVVDSEFSSSSASAGMKRRKVLVLGSGMVAGPAVDELARRQDVEVIVASNALDEAENLTKHYENAHAMVINMQDKDRLSALVGQADLVVSLLPAPFHPSVAELCIQYKTHLVTASYISPSMQALHSQALDAEVVLLNEIGLDPGIDHCTAHSLLARLRSENKQVVSFTSFCGGLPAPEAAEGVPLGYKFSWSPRGVLRAAEQGARFRLNGKNWDIPGERILTEYFPEVPISNVLKLEGLANRDSMPYADIYGLGSGLRTMLRGTLRYPGFVSIMHSFKSIGLLEPTQAIRLDSTGWASLVRLSLERQLRTEIPADSASLLSALSSVVEEEKVAPLWDALSWLGLVPSGREAQPSSFHIPAVPKEPTPPADLLAIYLAHTLRYLPHERDLVILSHEVVARSSDSSQEEIHTSDLVVYGDNKATAMARTVGLPVAFAALQVLDGKVATRGVSGPTAEDSLWKGVLSGLEGRGLGVKEGIRQGGITGVRQGMERVLEEGLKMMRVTATSA